MQLIVRNLLGSRYLFGALAALALQQVGVGLSVYFLASAAMSLPDATAAANWFLWFVASLVFPYLPGILANYLFELWALDSVRRFQTAALRDGKLQPTAFANPQLRESRSAAFSNTAPNVISDTCSYIHDLAATALNSLVSILAIAVVVSGDLLVSYAASLAGCIAYTVLFSPAAGSRAERSEQARIDLVAHTDDVWPVLTLGNRRFDNLWMERYRGLFAGYWTAARQEMRLRNASSLALSLISVGPTAILMSWLFFRNMGDVGFLASLLVTAPRAFQLLTMLGHFASLLFEANHFRGRLNIAQDVLAQAEPLRNTIDPAGVSAQWQDRTWVLASERQAFVAALCAARKGRATLSGHNGSGKSTLLLQLKEEMGENAIYLPPDALPWNGSVLSTGERKLAELRSVLAPAGTEVLLLDEWDANLDPQNRAQMDAEVARVAQSRLVVEVRHLRA